MFIGLNSLHILNSSWEFKLHGEMVREARKKYKAMK